MSSMTLNDLNFSGGPGVLPASVLRQASESILEVPDLKMSVLGVSHRSDWFSAVVSELENNVRELLGLPDDFHVLALQGGATQQFSMIPMSLLSGQSEAADYLHTGYWSGKAIPEARRHGAVRTVWSGESDAFRRLPGGSAAVSKFFYEDTEVMFGAKMVVELEAGRLVERLVADIDQRRTNFEAGRSVAVPAT